MTIEDVKFSYSSPCKHCPTQQGPDPESEEIMKWDFKERMEYRFQCAWRKGGFCYANAKSLYYGNRRGLRLS